MSDILKMAIMIYALRDENNEKSFPWDDEKDLEKAIVSSLLLRPPSHQFFFDSSLYSRLLHYHHRLLSLNNNKNNNNNNNNNDGENIINNESEEEKLRNELENEQKQLRFELSDKIEEILDIIRLIPSFRLLFLFINFYLLITYLFLYFI